ncbi:hypothetical protein [Sporosarcina cascadiensis]|uniref:hypothetical protein n=1 Tax=Sporosarcina cascadiensis TaxID=2660747 RepID=UPI00129ABB55|nr:hypothetical protein [Sporosarcina cascadiensis]
MYNKEKEIQKILKGKFMLGPKLLMNADLTGINYFSGDEQSAYYELYGNTSIFHLIIIQPSKTLFTNQYVGKNFLLFLLLEDEKVRGGFLLLNEVNLLNEFKRVFSYLNTEQVEELNTLWNSTVSAHYKKLSN